MERGDGLLGLRRLTLSLVNHLRLTMKLYQPDAKGKYVWQVSDEKTRQVSYSVTTSRTPPPNACYGHPMGKYDDQGVYMTFCPNVGADDPKSPLAARYVVHPFAGSERDHADKERLWRQI